MTFAEYITGLTQQSGWNPPQPKNESLVKFVLPIYNNEFQDTVHIQHIMNGNAVNGQGEQLVLFYSNPIPIEILDGLSDSGKVDLLMWMLDRNTEMGLGGHWETISIPQGTFFRVIAAFDAGKINLQFFQLAVALVLAEMKQFFEYLDL